jgi:single-stranded DNA-binding protein
MRDAAPLRSGRGGGPLRAGRESPVAAVAPEAVRVLRDRVELADGRLACTLAVTGYPRAVEAGWLEPLWQWPGEWRAAQHIEPVDTASALAELDRDLRGARASQQLADLRGAEPDARDHAAAADAAALREALARGDIRLFRHHLLITVFAPDEPGLARARAAVQSLLEGRLLLARPRPFEQAEGFASTMPLGRCALPCPRNLDSDALAAALPFAGGEFQGPGEVWGTDLRRGTPVRVDRDALPNPHLVVLGGSGGGKSYAVKHLLTQDLLAGRRAAVLDPQGEYAPWCRAVGGVLVRPGRGGAGLNPLLPPPGASGGPDWAAARTERAQALLDVLAPEGTPPADPGVVRAALEVAAAAGGGQPDLGRLAEALSASGPGGAGHGNRLGAALAGALQAFAGPGGDRPPQAAAVVFDLRDLGRRRPAEAAAAYLLLTQHVLDHMVGSGRPRLALAVDEAHHLLDVPVAARFVETLFRTGRKLGVAMTLATQSAADLVGGGRDRGAAGAAQAVLANAGLVLLMRQQNGREVALVRDLFQLDPAQGRWLLSCAPGDGLLVAGPRRALVHVEAPESLRPLLATDPAGPGAVAGARPPCGGPGAEGPAAAGGGGKGDEVMFNQATLIGRLTRDAEVGQLPNDRRTPRLRFTVAVDRDYEVDGETPTDFWPCEVVGEHAVRLAPFLTKGRLVLVTGAARIDERREPGQAVRIFPFVNARAVRFLDRRQREGGGEAGDGFAVEA